MLTRPHEPALALMEVVAAHGLGEAPRVVDVGGPLDTPTWRQLLSLARAERMLGLLDRAVADGVVPASTEQAADAEEHAAQMVRTTLALERDLLEVADALGENGVEFRVVKGAAVAHLDEDDPALRNYADIDLLVRGSGVAGAIAALGWLGFRRDLPERRRGYDRRFTKEVSLARPNGREVDLHRTIALGAFGLAFPLEALWARHEEFSLGGRTLCALDHEGRFVQACFNAMLGDAQPRLVALRDVARMGSRPLDRCRLLDLAPPGRGAAVVAKAIAAAESRLRVDLSPLRDLVPAGRPSRWERVWLSAYRSIGGSNTLELLSGALGLRGRSSIAYLWAVTVPSREYRRSRRAAGRPVEWRAGIGELRRRPSVSVMERGQRG